MSPPAPDRCPSCGFRYAWDGRACRHCHHPIPTREAWAKFDRMHEQVARYHTDPDPAGLTWLAVAYLRRVEHLLSPEFRSWPERVEECYLRSNTPLPRNLFDLASLADRISPDASTAKGVVMSITIELAATAVWQSHMTPAVFHSVCGRLRRAVGLAAFPPRPLDSFPLPDEYEPYREAALAETDPWWSPGNRREGDLNRRRAYYFVRSELARYEAQRRPLERAEDAAQCELYRCVSGYPFEPVEFAPAWRTPTAVALAQAIFADRAFDRLPILADALEEAGCDDADVLAHCRGDGPHVRGCWVVEHLRAVPDGGG